MNEPLASKLRPNKLSEVLGQEHLISEGKVLYNLIKHKKMFSMILYGKPGTGKTTLANVIANEFDLRFRELNAVINNKKDIDIVVEEAKMYGTITLIMDEIHRLNKDKQDLLLPHLESGLITLIGLTTSNPYHKINPAIRSRCQIFEIKPLSKENIVTALKRATSSEYLEGIVIEDKVLEFISDLSSGDVRYAYNLLELSYYASTDFKISIEDIENINTKSNIYYDANDDGHYNVISAFQKSIRGSDVDASLYYLAVLIESGDLDIIYRRLSAIVYEDISLGNSFLGIKLDAAINAAERLGLPEARLPLAQIVIEAALAPKTNSSYTALDRAISDVHKYGIRNVPVHLRDSAVGYLYPHNYKNSYVAQQYLPDDVKDSVYFKPIGNSDYEKRLKAINDNLKKLSNKK